MDRSRLAVCPTRRTMAKSLPVVVLALLLGAPPALAKPDATRLLLTPWGGYAIWADAANQENSLVYGGSIAFMFSNHLGVEGVLGYGKPMSNDEALGEVTMKHFGASLLYHPLGKHRISPYLRAGYAELRFEPEYGKNVPAPGFAFGGGVSVRLREGATWRTLVRLDVTDAYVDFDPPLGSNGRESNLMVSAALQVAFGDDWHRDSDLDQVIDRFDGCPETDTRIVVDEKGCPIDSDADGIFDGLDMCEATPTGAVIDSLGCPIDTDGDGVFDGLDQCEATPAGAVITAEGCPTDADGDGVFDGLDQCDTTPQGVRVDANGCPTVDSEEEQALYDTGAFIADQIEFESGKAELKPQGRASLDVVGQALTKWPNLRIEVGGHTDDRGRDENNLTLSQERAEAVRTYLLERFSEVEDDQLTAVGYGETTPIADNATDEGRAKNRRVEFRIVGGNPRR